MNENDNGCFAQIAIICGIVLFLVLCIYLLKQAGKHPADAIGIVVLVFVASTILYYVTKKR